MRSCLSFSGHSIIPHICQSLDHILHLSVTRSYQFCHLSITRLYLSSVNHSIISFICQSLDHSYLCQSFNQIFDPAIKSFTVARLYQALIDSTRKGASASDTFYIQSMTLRKRPAVVPPTGRWPLVNLSSYRPLKVTTRWPIEPIVWRDSNKRRHLRQQCITVPSPSQARCPIMAATFLYLIALNWILIFCVSLFFVF